MTHTTYVITDSVGLFWSNANGWGGIVSATEFTQEESETLNLPVADALGATSAWVPLNDMTETIVEPHCDICRESQTSHEDGWGDDWNGETGCHRSCEDAQV